MLWMALCAKTRNVRMARLHAESNCRYLRTMGVELFVLVGACISWHWLQGANSIFILSVCALQAPHQHIPAGAPHGAGPDQASASDAHARAEHACGAKIHVEAAA